MLDPFLFYMPFLDCPLPKSSPLPKRRFTSCQETTVGMSNISIKKNAFSEKAQKALRSFSARFSAFEE
ncbi:hypothetical protein SAMN04488522_102961 [Pedobacter caeni]|uniref:Uncharacterized protein n=1 Tax=Pedobacter caeni TaxID=288992 RepID=A0A1M5B004_9SPHI|nr:hypothetical protein SAMN04488522_102961 [Pedobacter caeni]